MTSPAASPARLKADFSRRSDRPELMDTEACDFETFRGCLVDLAKVNRLTLAHGPTLAFLERLRRGGRLPADRPLAVLDAGSGYGDLLRLIGRWARRHEVPVTLVGLDLNPWSARAAREATPAADPIRWLTADIFDFDGGVDVVVSSLFTHHLGDGDLVRFLRWMDATAKVGWFVNDLHRHPLPYHVFKAAARALRMHRFVQHDGPVSIARAFVASDWRRLLGLAGVDAAKVQVRWRFPFRLCLSRMMGIHGD